MLRLLREWYCSVHEAQADWIQETVFQKILSDLNELALANNSGTDSTQHATGLMFNFKETTYSLLLHFVTSCMAHQELRCTTPSDNVNWVIANKCFNISIIFACAALDALGHLKFLVGLQTNPQIKWDNNKWITVNSNKRAYCDDYLSKHIKNTHPKNDTFSKNIAKPHSGIEMVFECFRNKPIHRNYDYVVIRTNQELRYKEWIIVKPDLDFKILSDYKLKATDAKSWDVVPNEAFINNASSLPVGADLFLRDLISYALDATNDVLLHLDPTVKLTYVHGAV